MSSQWFCQVGNEQFGPMSSSDLKQLCREKRLLPENMVRQGKDGRWIQANQVQGLFAAAAPSLKQAAPLGPRISDSTLGEQIGPQVRAAVPNPTAAKPPPARGSAAPAPQFAAPPPPREMPAPQYAAPAPQRAGPAIVAPAAAPMQGVPMGVAVAPVPMGTPIGVVPVAVAPIAVAPFNVAASPAPSAPTGDEDGIPAKKKDNTALFVTVGLAACVLLLAGVGAAVGMGLFTPAPVEKKQVAANSPQPADPEAENFDPESASLAATEEPAKTETKVAENKTTASKGSATSKGKSVPAAKPEVPGKPTAMQDKSIRVVRQWVNVATMKNLTSGNLQLKILGSWYGGASGGAESSEVSTDEGGTSSAEKPAAAGRYVFVEVRLTNAKGPGPLSYKSWNGAGKKPEETEAILLDDEGKVCKLIGREHAPDSGRKQTAELAMGETLSDILVFEAPASFDYVKLVLPQSAVGRDGAWGFQLSRDWVAPDRATALAAGTPRAAPGITPGNTAGAQPTTGDDPSLVVDKPRPSETPSVKKPIDPDAPPSIKDIVERDLKSMKQKEAERKQAEQKAADEKAKPAP